MTPSPDSLPSRSRPGVHASLLALVLAGLYASNGDFLPVGDALPNHYLPVSVLSEGDLSFTPREAPYLFRWTLREGPAHRSVEVPRWSRMIDGVSAGTLRDSGRLELAGEKYFLTPSTRPGEYVGIYGPGPGLAALPVFAVGALVLGDLTERPTAVAWLGKTAALLLVSGSAAFLFLAAAATLTLRQAWVLALAYGLATCVWSQSSQVLWQQTPVLFFTSLGAWAWLRQPRTRAGCALAGFAFMAAAACRPTWGLMALLAGAWLAIEDRRHLPAFALGALPPLALMLNFSWHHLESLADYGQTSIAGGVALVKTGSEDVWQTPFLQGAAGILLSPSRGLLFYSPFLLPAFGGIWLAWRRAEHSAWRPFTLALAGLLGISFRWFDWWGGHSFGYRLIVDTVPLLVLLLIPITPSILARPWMASTWGVLIAWSLGVQVLGAFAYDAAGWNAPKAGVEVRLPLEPGVKVAPDEASAAAMAASTGGRVVGPHRLDVDDTRHRWRLWSFRENPVLYYATRFRDSRLEKRARIRRLLDSM